MARLFLVVAITIATVAFAMANMHFVALSPVIGQPVQIRLIFLLVCCFLAGMFSTWFCMMVRKIRMKRRSVQASARREMRSDFERQLEME
ncbi:MAG: DUF1049 domain-containing protein [Deltaproteobacteria bacterium]|nr:DUF1049 domain-containing protein [Deltaproteobacteria bacterium]